ncbi:response regulator transcription factor [Parapedobacter sp. DT-150]|uniref:response regulator transcription factor n=1 Tax=Parapedobacter sp. DT-150 TaxID=3396162 RepID=UPI003F1E0162
MKKAIYVLEDDADIGELVAFLLTEHGYEVSLFSNIASFRNQTDQPSPALVVIDVMLPDGSGLDVCQAWKDHPATSHIPVLLMSAYEDYKRHKNACLAEGFVSKPFDIKLLISEVERLVDA